MRKSCALWEREGEALLDGDGNGDGEATDVGFVLLIADTADRVRDSVALGATLQVRCACGLRAVQIVEVAGVHGRLVHVPAVAGAGGSVARGCGGRGGPECGSGGAWAVRRGAGTAAQR